MEKIEILESLKKQADRLMMQDEPMSPVELELANIVGCLVALLLHDEKTKAG